MSSHGGWISGASLTSTEPPAPDPSGVIGHLGTLRRYCTVVQAAVAEDTLDERIVADFIDECIRIALGLGRLVDASDTDGDPALAAAAQAGFAATAVDTPTIPDPGNTQPQEEPCAAAESRPPASRWKPAEPATGLDSRRDIRIVLPVEVSDRSPSASDPCDRCDGTGVMRWQQPEPDGQGKMTLREMEHPCPRPGCGPGWKHPAAERDRVIDAPAESPATVKGHAAAANQLPDALGEELLRIYAKYSRE